MRAGTNKGRGASVRHACQRGHVDGGRGAPVNGMALSRGTCAVRSRAILGHLQPGPRARAAVASTVASSAGAAVPKPLPDPHNVSHSLDAETSARIVDRLESRGQDEIFRSLFLGYFPDLSSCQNVLEIGCGTVHAATALAGCFYLHRTLCQTKTDLHSTNPGVHVRRLHAGCRGSGAH
jgi:hypothetical protein